MKIQISPTGNTYETKEEASKAKKYEYEIEEIDGITKQTRAISFKDLRPKEGWVDSNEPEEHLDEIAKIIMGIVAPKNILCISYKDKSLARRIERIHECKVEIMYDKRKGLILEYPEDRNSISIDVENTIQDKKFDLIIIRHYLEHFQNCEKIIYSLRDKLSDIGLIYLEVPDCNEFIRRKIPLYLWEQHRYYFTEDAMFSMLVKTGSRFSKIYKFGRSIEPSLCTLISKEKQTHATYNNASQRRQEIDHNKDLGIYTERWKHLIEENSGKEIIMFGAGHNADRFLQLTGLGNKVNRIIDDNKDKVNRYLAGMTQKIENTTYLKDKGDKIILLGCHDRSVRKCMERILTINKSAKIYSIYKLPGIIEK